MRHLLLVVVLAATVVGCAHAGRNPTVPVVGDDLGAHASRLHSELTNPAALAVDRDGPYRLWWEGFIYIDAAHERLDIVPRRDMHLHLNALKFLEEYCKDCLQITQIKNNGDGTIGLTVRITHPFKGFPQYTGFDVKGIIMFNGSYEYPNCTKRNLLPTPTYRISWRETGDPEILNPDGFTPRWSPNYQSGSHLPIFNYWEGRFAKGLPNADLNAYLNFYSDEERHMFRTGASVSRTYHVWLPPGPVTAGYAVEACWEPPLVTPVADPLTDFPSSANQPEAYHFKFVVNNGEVITDCKAYNAEPTELDCDKAYVELEQWGGFTSRWVTICWPDWDSSSHILDECDPPVSGHYYGHPVVACHYGNGTFRNVLYNHDVVFVPGPKWIDIAYTVFDYTVDDPDLE